MNHNALLIAYALPLAACNKSPEIHERNASVAEVAQKVRESGAAEIVARPGKWEMTSTVEQIEMPGAPPQAQAYIRENMARAANRSVEYCLTPEEAKRPGGKFFTGNESPGCTFEHFDIGGGKLDAAMRCEREGRNMTMEINGTYAPDSYTTHVAMKTEGGRQSGMVMKLRNEARRIGDCTGKEATGR